jgi:peptidoglycan/LPS O-acetylase OafA/YrhL
MPNGSTVVAESTRNKTFEIAQEPAPAYSVAIGYLRVFITLLVVAHHAALAYHPDASPVGASLLTQPRWWQAFPVVDSHRWDGFRLFVGFNDVFFMSLMFFLSGLFLPGSLLRKGMDRFLRDRTVRLGIPFILAAAIVAPIAYYPTYLQSGGSGISGFWREWLALGSWPAGPAWFVWVLLAFAFVGVGLYSIAPRWTNALECITRTGDRHPSRVFWSLITVSTLAYLPFFLIFGPFYWVNVGPFYFQASRPLLYLVYFLAGAAVGAYGVDRGLLAQDGLLARHWVRWSGAALMAFGFVVALVIVSVTSPQLAPKLGIAHSIAFALSCGASSFAMLAVFLRFAKKRRPVYDSLTANAYGIYLIHYAFVSWVQFGLLKLDLPGVVKGGIAFVVAALLSWGSIALLRRIPAVARVI